MLHSRRLLLWLAICLTVFDLSQIVAQDETPTMTPLPTEILILAQPPTETATETPTETPTDVPTATETATASQTASEIPTVEMSESSTPTLTAEASLSAEPAPTITLTASPSETSVDLPSPSATASLTPTATNTQSSDWKILFTDNFDTGQLMLWNLGKGWGLVPSEAGQALQVKDSDEPATFVYNTLGDASVQMRVLMTAGTVRLSIRQSDAGAYSLLLDANGQASLLRGAQVIGNASAPPAAELSQWHTISLSIVGNNLNVTVDGVAIITAQDAVPLPSGTFSIAGINAGTLLIDDVKVEQKNDTVLAAPVPLSTEVIPIPTPLNPNDLPFSLSDNLDGSDLSNWVGDVQDRRVSKGASSQLALSNTLRPVFLNQGYLKNVVLQLDLGVTKGFVRISILHSEAGSYTATFDADGSVLLYRGEEVIGKAATTPFAPDEMRTVNLQAIGGTITLSVAGKEVIRAVDDNPLPAGTILLSGGEGSFDNVSLSALIDLARANGKDVKSSNSTQSLRSNSSVMALVSTSPRIVFDSYDATGTGDSDIFMVNPDGSGLMNLTMNVAYDEMPSWSPDGTQIAFISDRLGGSQIYIMDVATRSVSVDPLTSGTNSAYYPSWSPDGQWISYQSQDANHFNQIYKVNVADTTIVQAVTGYTLADHFSGMQPDWSPGTGASIVLTGGFDAYLYRVDSIGQNQNLSSYAVQGVESDYSPDGTRVAYRAGNGASATIKSVGTGDLTIYNSPAFVPDWSPDGTQLVISKGSSNNADDLFIINATNGSIVNQVTSGSRLDGNPNWSNGVATTPTLTPTPTPTPVSSTLTLNPVADAYVDSANATTNYGTTTTLRTDASPIQRSYLRFQVPTLSGSVVSATLRVYANSAVTVGYTVHSTSGSWGETTITFANAPSYGSSLGTSGAITANTWTSVDVTALVTGAGQYNVVMATTNNTATSFSSREGANPPQLVIVTNGGTCPVGFAAGGVINSLTTPQSCTGTGLYGEYFNNKTLTGAPVAHRTEKIDFINSSSFPAPNVNTTDFSVRWSGQIEAAPSTFATDAYTFYTESDDGVRLWVNNQLLIDNWTDHAQTTDSGQIQLQAGNFYNIRIEYYNAGGGSAVQLKWSRNGVPPTEVVPILELYPDPGYDVIIDQNWSATERQAILTGLDNVSTALSTTSSNPRGLQSVLNHVLVYDGSLPSFIWLFRANSTTSTNGDPLNTPDVTVSYLSKGATLTVTYTDIPNGNCKSFKSGIPNPPAPPIPVPQAIICNGTTANLVVSEYTVAHELGHLFDYRTGQALSNGIDGGFALGSCITTEFGNQSYIIMGLLGGQFQRGSRGWGSGTYLSNFQQSPENTPLEAAADMFLNWVYRRNSPVGSTPNIQASTNGLASQGPGCIPIANQTPPFPSQNWSGFKNTNWATGSDDWGLPGDVRQAYMNSRMQALFQSNANW